MTTLSLTPEAHAAGAQAAEMEALGAASVFGSALRATPEYARLIATNESLRADPAAQAAIDALAERQDALRVEIAMNVLAEAQGAELLRLSEAMYAVPSVAAYAGAMGAFQALCRETAAVVTGGINFDFGANCRSGGCCG